jgi:hypothetical protein
MTTSINYPRLEMNARIEEMRAQVLSLEALKGAEHVEAEFEALPARPRITFVNEATALGARIVELSNLPDPVAP